MVGTPFVALLIVSLSVGFVLSTYPYLATAIAYRRRDNGLAYIVLIMGVGVWNGTFAAQLLSSDPFVEGYFLSLSTVGGLLAGLGWFLFAHTASSTPTVQQVRSVYGVLAVVVGTGIVLAITTPVHSLYWTTTTAAGPIPFATIVPAVGYWLHTLILVGLFGGGTILFGLAWRNGVDIVYTRAYTLFGSLTCVALVASNVLLPGGATLAPLAAGCLSTTGWIQAQKKSHSHPFGPLRRVIDLIQR